MFYIADTGLKQGKYESSWIFVLAPWTTKCHKEFLWTQTLLLTISLHVFAQACSDMHLPQRQKIASQFCTIFWITYSDTYTMFLKQKEKNQDREKQKFRAALSHVILRWTFFPHRLTCDCEKKKKNNQKTLFQCIIETGR